MAESRIVIVVDQETLRNFRAECIRRGLTPSKELARLMEEQVRQWVYPSEGGSQEGPTEQESSEGGETG